MGYREGRPFSEKVGSGRAPGRHCDDFGRKGVPRGVPLSPGNRLKSSIWPNRGNGVSKQVPSAPKMVPRACKMEHPKMTPLCSHLLPPAWFSNTLGGTPAPAHAPAQATGTMLIGHWARWRFWERMRHWYKINFRARFSALCTLRRSWPYGPWLLRPSQATIYCRMRSENRHRAQSALCR